jgi:hypothetical protein
LESLPLFLPEYKKIVVLLTDGLEEYNNYEDPDNNIYIDRRYINHYPWPVVTLYKHFLIKENKIDCDYVCYFNADITITKECGMDIFVDSKINFTTHSAHYDGSVERLYKHCEVDANKLSKYYNILSNTNNTDKYCQACFFLGPRDLFYIMCEDIADMINYDLQNNCAFLRWHDEHYLNVWVIKNKDLSYIDSYVNIYSKQNTIFFKYETSKNKVLKY